MEAKSLEEVPVVNEYLDVFPKETNGRVTTKWFH
jgi:hypothetical protein